MFKFLLSRHKNIRQGKRITFSSKNLAEIAPLFSSYLTNMWPDGGRIVTEWIISLLYGNKFFLNLIYKRQKKNVLYRKDAKSNLVISDLNIGDAINLQVACQTLKQLFLEKSGLNGEGGVVMFNPDATSPFTKFPLEQQAQLLKKLLVYDGVKYLLLGSGFVFKEMTDKIISYLKDLSCT